MEEAPWDRLRCANGFTGMVRGEWKSGVRGIQGGERKSGHGDTTTGSQLYAHLSRFARNLKVGDIVDQKQIIGYVGSTGRSTGPHLHFGLKHKGKFVNPLKVKYTMGPSIPASCKGEFDLLVKERISTLQSIGIGRMEKRS